MSTSPIARDPVLHIQLRPLPATILGIYGPGRDQLPERMRYLHPAAAASYLEIEATPQRLRVTDMLRSADSSLDAAERKSGVQRPGYSGHNFGLCIDIDVKDCMRRRKMAKATLDAFLAARGWYCHRKDHALAAESWHYSFLGTGAEAKDYLAASAQSTNTAAALEAKIVDLYGAAFRLDAAQVQAALRQLRLYSGAVDGMLGPLSRQAINAFQRAWQLPVTGSADARTQRTLAFVAGGCSIV